MGYTYKITNILAANCPRVANNILNLSLCKTVLPSGKILELTNLFKININKNFKITHISAATNFILFFFYSQKLRIMLVDMVPSLLLLGN